MLWTKVLGIDDYFYQKRIHINIGNQNDFNLIKMIVN